MAHSTNKHWYKKVDGVWKFAGLAPDIRWFEYDFDKVFEEGRKQHGDMDEAVKAVAGFDTDKMPALSIQEVAAEGVVMA